MLRLALFVSVFGCVAARDTLPFDFAWVSDSRAAPTGWVQFFTCMLRPPALQARKGRPATAPACSRPSSRLHWAIRNAQQVWRGVSEVEPALPSQGKCTGGSNHTRFLIVSCHAVAIRPQQNVRRHAVRILAVPSTNTTVARAVGWDNAKAASTTTQPLVGLEGSARPRLNPPLQARRSAHEQARGRTLCPLVAHPSVRAPVVRVEISESGNPEIWELGASGFWESVNPDIWES